MKIENSKFSREQSISPAIVLEQQKPSLYLIMLILMMLIYHFPLVAQQQNDVYTLQVEKMGDRYIYTKGDKCNVFEQTFLAAKPFKPLNIAEVEDENGIYMINAHGDRVSPFFSQLVYMENIGMFQGKEKSQKGWMLYDIRFNPLTTFPCDTIIKQSLGDYYLCRQGDHISVITGNGDCITDFVIPFPTDRVSISDSHYTFSYKKLDKNRISYLTSHHAIFELRKDMEYAYVDYQGNLLVPFCGYKESKKKDG